MLRPNLKFLQFAAIILTSASLVYPLTTASAQSAQDPAGNNGTIKIDRIPFDEHPNNEPHVGCTFQIDFFNYDEGDFNALYTFELHPPTGDGVLLTDSVFIGQDAAGGGGADLDAAVTINLSRELSESKSNPHNKQGYHVKLTVNAEGSKGSDVKHKVFWVEECQGVSAAPTPTVLGESTSAPTATPPLTTLPATGPGQAMFVSLLGIIGAMLSKKYVAR